MIHRLATVIGRAKHIFKTEGLISLLTRVPSLLPSSVFQHYKLYLYDDATREGDEADFMPRLEKCTVRIVSTHQQVNELEAEGFDLCSSSVFSRKHLDKGANAFCIFVERELAHLCWLAMTEEAKNSFEPFPYHVNFSNKEACAGRAITISKYRRNGLMTYGHFQRLQYLRRKGISTLRYMVNAGNLPSQRVHAKSGSKIYAKARYLKILWWSCWKEETLSENSISAR